MANIYGEQRLVDTNKRAVIKLTATIDGNNAANLIVVDTSTLAYAMNANNYLMVTNTHPRPCYNVAIKRVWGDVNVSGVVKLGWANDSNTDIIVLGPDVHHWNFGEEGLNAPIRNTTGANSTGDIIISTIGATANNSYTLFLELSKSPENFSQGQHADPAAFNR